jgi:NAD(P)-dependent dehydrogenase (short-subunit alcohol dehydrogenase family)
MNPVEEGDNQFAALFEAMPARRIGKLEDIAGAVLYLCSQAGVSAYHKSNHLTEVLRHILSHCIDGGRVLLANGQ